ncbi:MAG TPA: MBL fold metallo-hydrolase, partial [Thermomicrobiales bacterium]|nr:MBL fold metallo-hydrolase [Thermomicrobiales bacterium]
PIPLHVPPEGAATLRRIAQAFDSPDSGLEWFSGVFDINEYDPVETVTVGDLTCSFQPTVHFVPCWAIRVRPGDGSGDLFYTADTGPAAGLEEFGRGCSVVVAEAADQPSNDTPFEQRGHLTPQEAGQLAADVGAHTMVLTHIWEEHGIEGVMRGAGDRFSGTLLRAVPGLEIRWRS